jgi:hypothetical protein
VFNGHELSDCEAQRGSGVQYIVRIGRGVAEGRSICGEAPTSWDRAQHQFLTWSQWAMRFSRGYEPVVVRDARKPVAMPLVVKRRR